MKASTPFKRCGLWQKYDETDESEESEPEAPEDDNPDWQRTIIAFHQETVEGQDLLIKGGIPGLE